MPTTLTSLAMCGALLGLDALALAHSQQQLHDPQNILRRALGARVRAGQHWVQGQTDSGFTGSHRMWRRRGWVCSCWAYVSLGSRIQLLERRLRRGSNRSLNAALCLLLLITT